jgi:hypothetical protein
MYAPKYVLWRIARQQPTKHVSTHAPRNNTVEVFSSCPRMDRSYTTHVNVFSVIRGDVTHQ